MGSVNDDRLNHSVAIKVIKFYIFCPKPHRLLNNFNLRITDSMIIYFPNFH